MILSQKSITHQSTAFWTSGRAVSLGSIEPIGFGAMEIIRSGLTRLTGVSAEKNIEHSVCRLPGRDLVCLRGLLPCCSRAIDRCRDSDGKELIHRFDPKDIPNNPIANPEAVEQMRKMLETTVRTASAKELEQLKSSLP